MKKDLSPKSEIITMPKSLYKYRKILFFFLSLGFLFLFFFFSVLVKKHFFTQFDFDFTVKMQDNTPLKLNKLYPFFSFLASIESIGFLLLLLLIFRKKILSGFAVLFVFLASHFIELFGKIFIHHPPPPFMFYKHINASLFNLDKYYVQEGNSYPSGHSFRIVFLSLIFIYTVLNSRRIPLFLKLLLSFFSLVVIFFVGVSRVALGEHWTSDVIGGGIFGLVTGFFTLIFL